MGAKLALEAVAYCNLKRIDPVPRCLLMYMALRALDDASGSPDRPARLSFLRRSELGLALGRFMPDRKPHKDAPEIERRQWEKDDQAIIRALRALKRAGAIREVSAGRNGRTVEYEISLGIDQSLSVPLDQSLSVPLDLRSVSNLQSLSVPPRSTEDYKEKQGGQDHVPALTHLSAVESGVLS